MRQFWGVVALLMILVTYANLAPTLFRLSDGHYIENVAAALPFDSDEAIHAMGGLQIAADIYRRNIPLVFHHLYFTYWYPPGLSLYLAPFFIALGPTYWSARYPILLLTVIYLALIYRVAKVLSGRDRVGVIAVALAATSPVTWVHSLLCMEEMLAMVGMLGVIFIYTRHREARPIWLGLGMALTLLIRLSVGISTAAAVFVALMFSSDDVKANLRLVCRVFWPFLVVCGLWWGHPLKIADFIRYLKASAPAYEVLGAAELLHYWKALVTSYAVSPWVGAVVLVSVVSAFRWADADWRLPLIMVLMTWIMLLIERQLNLRFFMSAVTAAFLLAANAILKYGARSLCVARPRHRLVVCSVLALVLVVGSLPYLEARIEGFLFLMRVRYETDVKIDAVNAWIAKFVTANHPIFLVNGWDQLSTPLLDFYFAARWWPPSPSSGKFSQVRAVFLEDPQMNPEAVAEFQRAANASPLSYLIYLENAPVPNAGAWWAYRAVLEPHWDGEWQAVRTFWVRVWDKRLRTEIMARPLYYARPQNRQTAQEQYGYPLPIEVKVATLAMPPE